MKNKIFLTISLVVGASAATSFALIGNSASMHLTNADNESYQINFNSSKNKLHSCFDGKGYDGEAAIKTDLGSDISFSYHNVKGSNGIWQSLNSDGYFSNIDPIHGMESISLVFTSSDVSYSIFYSGDESFEKSKSFMSKIGLSNSFNFDGCKPNYFKLVNGDLSKDLDIASIRISLSCQNSYHTISLLSNDESMGTVSGGGVKKVGSEVTITATANEGYIFKGWYDETNLISKENPYEFTMPSNDCVITARFLSESDVKHATFPIISDDDKTIKYGLYPQTNVNDSSLISSLNSLTKKDNNGWYMYNGDYYVKATAKLYDTFVTHYFANGTAIKEGNSYWFKCEPIEWNILESNADQCFVTSRFLLDCNRYSSSSDRKIDGETIYANNYKYSHIREWLNGDFYNSAFCLGNENALVTTIDNSSSSTGESYNQNACENTYDKVFLLSYKELTDSNYAVSKFPKATDYALCKGIITAGVDNDNYWWLRSPVGLIYTNKAKYVGRYGNVSSDVVSYSYYGIRPAMRISLD